MPRMVGADCPEAAVEKARTEVRKREELGGDGVGQGVTVCCGPEVAQAYDPSPLPDLVLWGGLLAMTRV